MYQKTTAGKSRTLGISRLEMGFIALFVVFGGLLAATKYFDLSSLVAGSMDQGVVKAVREGVDAYSVNARTRGRTPIYPPILDDAKTGLANPQNLFFSHVLQRGIAVEGWVKEGTHEYRAPTGKTYIYDPQTGSFETRANMTAEDINRPTESS